MNLVHLSSWIQIPWTLRLFTMSTAFRQELKELQLQRIWGFLHASPASELIGALTLSTGPQASYRSLKAVTGMN